MATLVYDPKTNIVLEFNPDLVQYRADAGVMHVFDLPANFLPTDGSAAQAYLYNPVTRTATPRAKNLYNAIGSQLDQLALDIDAAGNLAQAKTALKQFFLFVRTHLKV